jgi:hypothetical protein
MKTAAVTIVLGFTFFVLYKAANFRDPTFFALRLSKGDRLITAMALLVFIVALLCWNFE